MNRKRWHRSVALSLPVAALLAPCPAAHAQESAQEPAEAWDIVVELGLNAARGNTTLTLFSSSLEVTRLDTDRFELAWSASGLYGENADSVIARRYATALSFDWHPEATISPFVFVDAARDRFRKLDLRTNGGAGAKYVLWREERTSGSISAAVLHNYENFTTALPDLPASRSTARWSVRPKAAVELANGLKLEHVSFFKPVFEDLSDYDFDASTKTSLRVSERLAFMVSWVTRYDSTPPPDVHKADQTVQLGISIDF
jgi:putative salt-induced outer membrane protein YdiY